jgi:hypothetical protein
MSCAGVLPALCLQRALTLALRAWTLALQGVICRLAGFPWGRSYWRRVCPKQSKPCEIGVMTVFVGDSLTPRAARTALIRGRAVSAKTTRAPVGRYNPPRPSPFPFWVWSRMAALAPRLSRCVTARLHCRDPYPPFPATGPACGWPVRRLRRA